MSGSNNILQFNPTKANQEDDTTYTSDSLRVSGGAVNEPVPSPLFNKVLYQLSTVCAALGAMLATKGYAVSDASITTLEAVLANIMTQSDMAPYALLASPALSGAPTTTTPAAGDNSARIPNTNWVDSLFAPINNPTFTGLPNTPSPPSGDNSNHIPTTNWLRTYFAPLDSAGFTGTPTAPTAPTNDSTNKIANTAWVQGLSGGYHIRIGSFNLPGGTTSNITLSPVFPNACAGVVGSLGVAVSSSTPPVGFSPVDAATIQVRNPDSVGHSGYFIAFGY